MIRPVWTRREGTVVYRSRTMSAKQLAQTLRTRCLSEFHDRADSSDVLVHRVLPSTTFDGGYGFEVDRFEPERPGQRAAAALWIARVEVTPQLDIVVVDEDGRVERSVLDCALRGPQSR